MANIIMTFYDFIYAKCVVTRHIPSLAVPQNTNIVIMANCHFSLIFQTHLWESL